MVESRVRVMYALIQQLVVCILCPRECAVCYSVSFLFFFIFRCTGSWLWCIGLVVVARGLSCPTARGILVP